MDKRILSDEELLGIIKKNAGGGGGGTTNYNQLENKPQIGGVTLTGNKSASDLGLADDNTVQGILDGQEIDSFGDVETALEGKQDALVTGDYIAFDGNEISVDRDLHGDVFTYDITVEQFGTSLRITKKRGDTVLDSQVYNYNSPLLTVDDAFTIGGAVVERFMYTITLLRASTTNPSGYVYRSGATAFSEWTQDFEADLSPYKLVIKSEMDDALLGKQNAITAGDDLKFSGSTLNVEVSVPYIDEYDLSTNADNWTVITKKHKGEVVSTDIYPSGIYTTYNIDDCFTLQYGGSPAWIITLTKASTIASAGTTYGWEYAQTPAVSNIQFELAETGTASEFIADLNDALAGKQDTLTFDDVPTANSDNPVKSGGIYDALADKANASDVKKEFGGTLEQWNALTTEEKKEYDAYDITDDYSDGNYIYLPTIYSEEEREVGVWKDGKPLYQKTVVVNSPTYDTDWHNVSHGISNIDSIIRVNGAVKNAESGSAEEFYDLSVYRPNSQTGIVVGATKTNVTYINNWLESATELWVTLQYTKTTDTAGSGTWTPTGQYAHHYSTDEQIVGTWIDGSTLYERTITGFSLTLQSGVAKDTEVDISYVSKLISVDALGDDDISVLPVAGYKINNTLQMLGFMNGNVINKAVIQYTKTA